MRNGVPASIAASRLRYYRFVGPASLLPRRIGIWILPPWRGYVVRVPGHFIKLQFVVFFSTGTALSNNGPARKRSGRKRKLAIECGNSFPHWTRQSALRGAVSAVE